MKGSRLLILTFILLCFSKVLSAQWVQVSGRVYDKSSQLALVNTNVQLLHTQLATTSNQNGQFKILSVPIGSYQVVVSHVGYFSDTVLVELTDDVHLEIGLQSGKALHEVEILEDKVVAVHDDIRTSVITLQMDKVKTQPVLLGEPDVIKAIQMLPGVQAGMEGLTGMYVRGGGSDQNLILLDGVPLYNVNHMLGVFSVFNPGAIESAELIKGGFPARFGGRLSSVLDIRTKKGNAEKWEGEGSVGIMSGRMSANGPLVAGKTSLSLSLRRSYYDMAIRPFLVSYSNSQQSEKINVGYYFNDLNIRLDHKIDDRRDLVVNGFLVRDNFYIDYTTQFGSGTAENTSLVSWGTALGQILLNTQISEGFTNKTSLSYNRYRFLAGLRSYDEYQIRDTLGNVMDRTSESNIAYKSYINDYTARTDYVKTVNSTLNLRFGASLNFQLFQPGASISEITRSNIRFEDGDTTFKGESSYSQQVQSYFEYERELGHRFKLNLGAHLNVFRQADYWSGSLQPRLMTLMRLGPKSSLKMSYSMMQQNLHLLTNPSVGLPTDLWVPATEIAPSELSHQVAFGYAATLPKNLSLTAEVYYKTMQNVIEYDEGELFLGIGDKWEESIQVGRGKAYGFELLLEKRIGKLSGWLGYTYSFTNRQFDSLNNGNPFPYRYDRRHDISVVLHYKKSEKFDFGLNWVYGTGYAFSIANGSSRLFDYVGGDFLGQRALEYTSRNNYRSPSYHRLDIGFNFHKKKKWGRRTWQLGVYNAYNHMNPFMVFWDDDFDYSIDRGERGKMKILTLLPIIPSITYQFKF